MIFLRNYRHENGSKVGSGTVGTDGYFTLKAGQQAVFNNLLETYERAYYIVEERIPADFREQYGDILIENSGEPVECKALIRMVEKSK